jgi:hypothetical protein
MTNTSAQQPNPRDLKRRKVRKGTHSCWECRRRKIKCAFDSEEDAVCAGCRERGSFCRSQEFADDAEAAPPAQSSDRTLGQRLGRLEAMMAQLVAQGAPAEALPRRRPVSAAAGGDGPLPSPGETTVAEGLDDVLDQPTLANDTPVANMLGIQDVLSGDAAPLAPETGMAKLPHLCAISRQLRALFPVQEDLNTMVRNSNGASFSVCLFHSHRDVSDGKAESPESVAVIPSPSSHPAVLARRLLQLVLCIQQLPPDFHVHHKLQMREPPASLMQKILFFISHHVAFRDELVGNLQGLECLVLLSVGQTNFGNLRKAWMTSRRALSLGQLMAIDRGAVRALKSVDPTAEACRRPTATMLWYRIQWVDRWLSLLLGMPMGSQGDSFAAPEHSVDDTPAEKLEKQHTVIMARLVERNLAPPEQAFTMTQSIDYELDTAARLMGQSWWRDAVLNPLRQSGEGAHQKQRAILQLNHFCLLILLHVPYMLRDPAESRYDYCKARCRRATREVLKRFSTFRSAVVSAHACRHVDYAALIAAMTLLLGYLNRTASAGADEVQRADDRALVERARGYMEQVAVLNQDRLSRESADMIQRLLPIIDLVVPTLDAQARTRGQPDQGDLHVDVPYLGTVNLHAGLAGVSWRSLDGEAASAQDVAFDESQTASSQTEHSDRETDGYKPYSFSATSLAYSGGVPLEFTPHGQGEAGAMFPEATADLDDWALQGVDTTYWSLLNGGRSDVGMDL